MRRSDTVLYHTSFTFLQDCVCVCFNFRSEETLQISLFLTHTHSYRDACTFPISVSAHTQTHTHSTSLRQLKSAVFLHLCTNTHTLSRLSFLYSPLKSTEGGLKYDNPETSSSTIIQRCRFTQNTPGCCLSGSRLRYASLFFLNKRRIPVFFVFV